MSTFTPNYNLEKPEASDPFENFRQSYNNNMDEIDRNLGGGGGSGGHTIYDKDGNALAQESGLQFTGSVNVTDDNVNGRTVVDITGGGGSNLILDAKIYSDNEKVVGVWRDNKPLYQRTIYIPSLPNATEVSYPHNISNLDKVVEIFGVAYNSSNYSIPITFANPTSVAQVTAYTSPTDIYIGTGMDRTSFVGYITLLYTKTTDVAGSGGYEAYGFSPVIYSDVERVIGVWRDNKPLYQRTVEISNVSYDSNWHSVAHGISNIEFVAQIKGIMKTTSNYFYNCDVFRPSTTLGVVMEVTATNINYINSWIDNADKLYVTLLYTKTTDVAGSGDYNTYGVPTVHYDTNEQVIGTWITGKPLYERTFSLGALPNNSIKTVAHGIANVDLIFIADSFFQTGAGASSYLNFTNDSTVGQVEILVDRTNFEIWAGSDRTSWNGYATVRYTKTTD